MAAQAWALIPDEMWVVLGASIAFFFGDRTLLAARRSKGPSLEQVQAVLATQAQIEAARPRAPMEPDRYKAEIADAGTPLSEEAIREWNRRHGADAKG